MKCPKCGSDILSLKDLILGWRMYGHKYSVKCNKCDIPYKIQPTPQTFLVYILPGFALVLFRSRLLFWSCVLIALFISMYTLKLVPEDKLEKSPYPYQSKTLNKIAMIAVTIVIISLILILIVILYPQMISRLIYR
ncbi:unnamed protein product [marine sediment metagenome]|uniref:Uncharacterized protein n=1 Tax=marine sediment metagenome TaxID=412755 RepID=X1S0V9_9ZZZZ